MQALVLDTLFFPSEQSKEKFAQYIENAKQSIDISIFCFSNQYFALKVLEQSKNGLNVRILSDQEQCEETYSLVGALKETSDWKIKVRINNKDGIPRMHNKYIIIDNQIVLTGSFNFSDNALKCYENIVVMQGYEVAQKYTQNFEEIWQANNRNFTYNTDEVKVGIKKFAEYVENQQEVMGKQLLGERFAQKKKYNINDSQQQQITKKIKKNNYDRKEYNNSYKQYNNNSYKQYNKKQNYSQNKYNKYNKYDKQSSSDSSFNDIHDNFEGNQYNNYHCDSDSDSDSYYSSY